VCYCLVIESVLEKRQRTKHCPFSFVQLLSHAAPEFASNYPGFRCFKSILANNLSFIIPPLRVLCSRHALFDVHLCVSHFVCLFVSRFVLFCQLVLIFNAINAINERRMANHQVNVRRMSSNLVMRYKAHLQERGMNWNDVQWEDLELETGKVKHHLISVTVIII